MHYLLDYLSMLDDNYSTYDIDTTYTETIDFIDTLYHKNEYNWCYKN